MTERTFAFMPGLFDLDSAAHYLSISRRLVEEYIIKGDLNPVALRRPTNGKREGLVKHSLITKEELDRFIREEAKRK